MPSPSRAHRASAQRRRESLLDAAAELAAEVGAGAVTHRAVAARAGVPLSTTSYFFSSIDELVSEALRRGVQGRVADFDAAERAWVLGEGEIDAVIEAVIDEVLAPSATAAGSHVEFFLAAGRDVDLQSHASATVRRFAERTTWQLDRLGAVRGEEVAWALQALGDGAMLHRLAGVETDHRSRLRAGTRALLAAAMLSDAEVDELLGRFDRSRSSELTVDDADTSGDAVGV
jgi:DNA-binding transcriptional regulator YbjK